MFFCHRDGCDVRLVYDEPNSSVADHRPVTERGHEDSVLVIQFVPKAALGPRRGVNLPLDLENCRDAIFSQRFKANGSEQPSLQDMLL